MLDKRLLLMSLLGITTVLGSLRAEAGDLKITIPRRSKLTPVQRLNREGVEAIRKHNYAKAEQLFYKIGFRIVPGNGVDFLFRYVFGAFDFVF